MSSVDTEDIFVQIRKVLSRMIKLKESTIALESHLRDDLGVDSVDIWEVSTKMEEEFSIEVKENDIVGINTVQDIVALVKRKMKAAKG